MSVILQSVAYKESGIPWVGKIPEHWEMRRVKYLFFISKEENTNENPNVLSLTQRGIIERDISTNQGQLAQSYLGYNIVEVGDIVFNPMDLLSGYVAKSQYNGVISQAYTKIRNKVPLDLGFYEKFFQNWYHLKTLWHLGKGVSHDHRWTLGDDVLLNLEIPLPSLQEQKAIADFLDKKTRQIEEFIDKKQKLITLLEEKKQTLINQCVTQGLDTSAPLKDSGVEWLGKIPTHWEVRKLKLLFGIGSGLGITKADFVSSGIPCVSYGEIHSKYPCRLDTGIHPLPYVSEDYLESKPQALLKKGDFVFADTSEDIEGSGNFTSLQSDEPVFAGYHTIVLKPKTQSIHSPYFSFLFDSLGIRNQVRKEVCGVKVYSITKSILNLIPPLEEQKAIAEYLDTQIEKIDLAICKIKSQINLIKEYKTTLISEAVCGRVGIN